jgi:superfamily II DNA or RNA helicase
MPKALINSRILLDVTDEQAEEIRNKLTYKIPVYSGHKNKLGFELIRNYSTIKRGIMSIPQGRQDLIPEDHEILERRTLVPTKFPEPKIPLRNEQVWVHEQVVDSCFINALVGWGKTFAALHIAKKLKQKTLVIVHTVALRTQWVQEVEKLYGFTPDIIGSGKFDIETPIVIGNIQSLNKVVDKISDKFGTVIVDEAHHTPSTTFTSLLDKMKSRYRIGLSGTLKRKDEKHVMFPDFFSPTVYVPELKNETMLPTVRVIKTGITLVGSSWAKKVNNLLYDPTYQAFVSGIAEHYLNEGHCVLLVAERTEFLENCNKLLSDRMNMIIGETKNREELLDEVRNGTKQGILGTRQIFSEGISINPLSCLILTSPINNDILLEQLIGRVMRKHPGKLDPVVVDLHFSGRTGKTQNSNRLGFYMLKDWKVEGLIS